MSNPPLETGSGRLKNNLYVAVLTTVGFFGRSVATIAHMQASYMALASAALDKR